jgi:hypothetical protein
MNILILHRIPYQKIDYHRGIDHERHDVTYFGKREIIETLPKFLRCKTVERPGVASAFEEAREWLTATPQQFDRIFSLSEYELLDAARLREWLGVSGPAVERVRLARDKILMKTAVSEAGLRVPRFLSMSEFLCESEQPEWNGTVVLKPHSGASSEEVVLFPNCSVARRAVADKRTGVPSLDTGKHDVSDYEVEEFINGPILHLDGLVRNGQLLAMTASEYVGNCLLYANGEPLGSRHFPVSDNLRAWASRALDATGISDGSFHLEAIQSGDELVFLEVANRVGGADVVRTFELATGIHLPSQELGILLGEPVDAHVQDKPEALWHGWFVYPGHHLKDVRNHGLIGAEAFRQDPSIVHWHELEVGADLPRNITYQAHEVPLAGVVATPSAALTHAWIERLFGSVSSRTSRLANAPKLIAEVR